MLWASSGINMTRKKAYRLLAAEMGVEEVHIAEQDINGCEKIIEISREILRRLTKQQTTGDEPV